MINNIEKNTLSELSIIIPVFNEEAAIEKVISNLKTELKTLEIKFEIITVNDGSSDKSGEILKNIPEIRLINHPYNKGYGAALKTGINNAKYGWVIFCDADGQHKPEYIKEFIKYSDEYDLIAGDRSNGKYVRPTLRKPGLWLLRKIANYLVDYKIPDLNCGFRLINKKMIKKYEHFLPDGFSLSTTSTLAFLKDKKNVKFLPIEVEKRNENTISTVKPYHAITTLLLLFRLIVLFSPLRIFLPFSVTLAILSLGFLVYDLSQLNLSESTVFIFLTSILIFFFGLIADQIATLRRGIYTQK